MSCSMETIEQQSFTCIPAETTSFFIRTAHTYLHDQLFLMVTMKGKGKQNEPNNKSPNLLITTRMKTVPSKKDIFT